MVMISKWSLMQETVHLCSILYAVLLGTALLSIKYVFAACPDFIVWIVSIITLADTLSPAPSLLCIYKAKQALPSLVVLRLPSVSESPGGQVRLD